MRKIIIKNFTNEVIVVKWADDNCLINAGENVRINISGSETLRVYKYKNTSSSVYFGKCLSKSTVREWLYFPLLFVNFDALIETKDLSKIEITEKTYDLSMWSIFNILLVNGKTTTNYDFHESKDVSKYKLLSVVNLAFLGSINLFLLFSVLVSAFLGWFSEMLSSVLWEVFLYGLTSFIIIKFAKSINRFLNFSKFSKEIIKNTNEAIIFKIRGRLIEYTKSEVCDGSLVVD